MDTYFQKQRALSPPTVFSTDSGDLWVCRIIHLKKNSGKADPPLYLLKWLLQWSTTGPPLSLLKEEAWRHELVQAACLNKTSPSLASTVLTRSLSWWWPLLMLSYYAFLKETFPSIWGWQGSKREETLARYNTLESTLQSSHFLHKNRSLLYRVQL